MIRSLRLVDVTELVGSISARTIVATDVSPWWKRPAHGLASVATIRAWRVRTQLSKNRGNESEDRWKYCCLVMSQARQHRKNEPTNVSGCLPVSPGVPKKRAWICGIGGGNVPACPRASPSVPGRSMEVKNAKRTHWTIWTILLHVEH